MSVSGSSNPSRQLQDRRKLLAVLYADMVDYSRLIALDDAGTLQRLRALRSDLIDPAIEAHGGRIVQTGGDSLLIVFDSIDGAMRCAINVQRQIPSHDAGHPPNQAIRFRVGIEIGDAIVDGTDLHGDVVNIAARLQAVCPSGGICFSQAVRDHVRDRLNLTFEELGPLTLKNISRPVHAFVLKLGIKAVGTVSVVASMPDRSLANAPRLSLVVLPFDNLSGKLSEEYIADAITEDLTTDMSRWPEATVIARNSAVACKARSLDVRQIGQELGVRYVIKGSVRKVGETLRVTVQLISTETNAHLWAQRFDQDVKDLGNGQDEIVARLGTELGIQLLDTEIKRTARERPTNPDALDLILRALSSYYRPFSTELSRQTAELMERALELDPSSTLAMCGIADSLLDRYGMSPPDLGNQDLIERAGTLVRAAATLELNNPRVIFSQGYLLSVQGRRTDAISTFQRLVELSPNFHAAYRHLGFNKIFVGQAEEAIPLLRRSIRFDPLNSYNRSAYGGIGNSLLLLGDNADSIQWQLRALAEGATAPPVWRAQRHLFMSCAHASLGELNSARHALTEAIRIWPFATARNLPPTMTPHGLPDLALAAQMTVVQESLRGIGLRDHSDEDADFGVTPASASRSDLIGFTPTTVPLATTIRTEELVDLLQRRSVILIDVALYSWGRSIPGAIGLQGSGHGDTFSTEREDRLRRKIQDLTNGDLSTPIVAFCANSERFTGYNLALRLVSLGYQHVYWYRGGFEAWQVNGLPESDLELHAW